MAARSRPRDSLAGCNASVAATAPSMVSRGRARTMDQKHSGSTFRIGHHETTPTDVVTPKSRPSYIPKDNLGPSAEQQPLSPSQRSRGQSQYTPRDHLGPSASSHSPIPASGKAHTTTTRNHMDNVSAALNHGAMATPIKREKKIVKETVAPNKHVPVENQENQTPRDSARKRYHQTTIQLAGNYDKPLPLQDNSHRVLKNMSSLASDNGQLTSSAPVRAAGKARAPTAGGEGLNLFASEKAQSPVTPNKPHAGRTSMSSVFTSNQSEQPLRPIKQIINTNNQQTSIEQGFRPARANVRPVNAGASTSNIISWQ